ncbi:hypothetical protein ACHAXS_000691 [Conticribra weissflogii]
MMSDAIDSATHFYGDNMSIIKNTSKPESTLNKTSNAVCYQAVRESVVMGENLIAHITGAENPADLMTKVLSGSKHQYLVWISCTTYMAMIYTHTQSVNEYTYTYAQRKPSIPYDKSIVREQMPISCADLLHNIHDNDVHPYPVCE